MSDEKKYDAEYFDRRMNDPDEIAKVPDVTAPNVGTIPLVRKASSQELRLFGDQGRKICLTCSNFKHREGQESMRKQNFVARLVHELWGKRATEYLTDAPQNMGLCAAKSTPRDEVLVGPSTPACESYRKDPFRR